MLNDLVESIPLAISVPIGLIGFFLTIYVMVNTSYEREDIADPIWLQWTGRLAYALVALALMWSLNYQLATGWHPWPPAILLMLGLIAMMIVRAIAIRIRINRTGSRRLPEHHFPHINRSG